MSYTRYSWVEVYDTSPLPSCIRISSHGVNYVDTAYPYHNGESEPFVGRALQGEYREKVNLANKLPSWLIKSR